MQGILVRISHNTSAQATAVAATKCWSNCVEGEHKSVRQGEDGDVGWLRFLSFGEPQTFSASSQSMRLHATA
eukprot:m.195810 g.195810  ORF g.195810 m.195810 type:complete len:72 (-) comp14899_c1_seq5:2163-2378(-)